MPEQPSVNNPPMKDRDGRCRVQVSANKMEASLCIEPPLGEGEWPTRNQAFDAIRMANITYGIMESEVDEVIRFKLTKPVIIAKGKPPIPGRDAEIKLLFESGVFRKASIEDESGRIDFRQVQTVQNVTAGQVIAEKIPATPGTPGMDVFGHEIPAVPGKDKTLKLGKNVAWSDDGLTVYAVTGGEPVMVGGRISVHPVHEIKGNVNFDTGNIMFSGNLVIYGNVESGFKVEAEGDVTIYGNVDSADIKAGGNLFIQGGVSGMDKTEIFCGGDFSAKYIEHASVTCEGNLTSKEAIMHCQINADLKINVEGGKGLIVGGLIRSGEEISAKVIGSRLGTVTELEVGIRPKMKLEFQELENQLKNNTESLDKAEKAIAILGKIPNLPDERKEMLHNLIKTSYALKSQIAEAEAKRQEMLEEMQSRSRDKGRIRVKDTIYPGVRVSMGKTTIMIQDEIRYATLVYSDGEIQILPYR
ncbi:MAG: FapA family protein [Firmicutes bacterium]|nr:FapA family protein [Bacillota bacterium]